MFKTTELPKQRPKASNQARVRGISGLHRVPLECLEAGVSEDSLSQVKKRIPADLGGEPERLPPPDLREHTQGLGFRVLGL